MSKSKPKKMPLASQPATYQKSGLNSTFYFVENKGEKSAPPVTRHRVAAIKGTIEVSF